MNTIILHNLNNFLNVSTREVFFVLSDSSRACELIDAGSIWYCYCPHSASSAEILAAFAGEPTPQPQPQPHSQVPIAAVASVGAVAAVAVVLLVVAYARNKGSQEDNYESLESNVSERPTRRTMYTSSV